ncbi:hypothetical protein NTGBS_200002 [Candidatus Nitrotoga sp. BS]|uniref:hypothetical protein n=1 Tax=Candidatus Nitrotoga sp. BS TaxID=2890408 RepID=UPI001EF3A136|nr:hypothetical protein [Candidatus Nitrotoga sp. BS]CAH1195631.1 hypothetical protein NTGBS_200002 [Candidatus Nitrotoga sp. BS]
MTKGREQPCGLDLKAIVSLKLDLVIAWVSGNRQTADANFRNRLVSLRAKNNRRFKTTF